MKACENDEGVDLTFPINGLPVVSSTVVAKEDGHAVNAGMVELEDAADKTQKPRMAMVILANQHRRKSVRREGYPGNSTTITGSLLKRGGIGLKDAQQVINNKRKSKWQNQLQPKQPTTSENP